MTRRAGIYARISRDELGEGQGVARQIADCQELAARRGWQVLDVYEDNDVSATRGKPRPEHQRLLIDIRAGRVDAVVVWDLDRLYRLPAELEEFLALAKERRLELASVGGDVDLSTEQGVLVAGIKAQVGRYESQQNSRRVLRKQRELREAGKPFSGGIRSYGYDTDRTTLIQVEAEEIRRMVRLLLSGHSVGHIVRDLNERSVPTVSQWMAAQPRKGDRATIVGKPWGRTSVRTLLERPRLAGLLTYRGEVVGPGQWEPILDQETFRRVQVALSQRRPHQASSNARKYLLSGIATCGECGRGVQVAHHGSGKDPYRRYRCPSEKHGGRNIRALDEYVIGCFFDFLDAVQDGTVHRPAEDPAPEIERLRQRLNDAADQYADDVITAEQMQRISTRLRREITDLEALRPSPAATTLLDWYFGTSSREQSRREWDRLDLSQQRLMLATHLGRIAVHRAKVLNRGLDTSTIEVTWNLSAGHEPRPVE